MRLRAAVLLLALAGCAGNQKLLGRYGSATCRDEAKPGSPALDCRRLLPSLGVSVVLEPKAPDKAADASGKALPERALARYIEALGRYSRTAADLRRNLAASIEPPHPPSPFTDESTANGTLTLTAAYADFNPADRIDRLDMTVTLGGGSIKSWTGARTAYSDIKPGQITSTGKVSLSGTLDIKPPAPFPLGGTLTASTDRTRQETLDVVQRVEDITPIVRPPRSIEVVRRGGFGLDLTGNVQVDVVLAPDNASAASPVVFTVTGWPARGRAADPRTLQLTSKKVRIAEAPLTASVTADYVVRHIAAGDETSEEGDDTVEFVTRHYAGPRMELVPARTQVWGVRSTTVEVGGDHTGAFVAVVLPGGGQTNLCFERASEAQQLADFLAGLRTLPAELGGMRVGLNKSGLLPLQGGGWTPSYNCEK